MKLRKSIVTLSAVAAGATVFAAPAAAHTYQHSTRYRGDVQTPANLQAIAECESGGDPAAIGGGGAFRGKYQFMQSTWDNVAPKGYAGVDPATAPESVQDKAAANLLAQSGSSPWPVCGS
jgi:Transglycosylase-like domain